MVTTTLRYKIACNANARILSALVATVSALVLTMQLGFTAETNVAAQVKAEFILGEFQKEAVYCSGDPIRIKCSLTNTSDKPITVKWAPMMLSWNNVKIWAVSNAAEIQLESAKRPSLPRIIPATTINPRASLIFETDIVDLYDPAECLFNLPSPRLLYEAGEYIMQLHFRLHLVMEQGSEVLNIYSDRLRFHVRDLDMKKLQPIMLKLADKETSRDARVGLATLLFINLDGEGRSDLARKCLKDADMNMRNVGLAACERYRIKEHAPTIRELIEKDEEDDVRANAMFALGAVDPVGSVPVLILCAEQRKDSDRRAAIQKLGELGDRRALPTLQKILGKNNLDADTRDLIRITVKTIESR